MRREARFAFVVTVLSLALAVLSIAAAESLVTIASDGTVDVYVKANVSEGLNTIPAPVEPVPATIEARINGTELVPIVYSENMFYVVAGTPGFIVINYMANTTVHEDGSISFKILNTTTTLLIRPGIVLLSLPENIYSVEYVKGSLKLVVEGPALIRYVLVEEATTTTATTSQQQTTPTTPTTTPSTPLGTTTTPASPTTSATASTPQATTTLPPSTTVTTVATGIEATEKTSTPTPTTASATTIVTSTSTTQPGPTEPPTETPHVVQQTTSEYKPSMREEGGPSMALWVGILVVIAVISIGLGYFITIRKTSRGSTGGTEVAATELDDTDRLILGAIDEHGGSMLQSELLRETGLPKTTLWRHVRKLERLGYIKIVREGRANRLILLRKPPHS